MNETMLRAYIRKLYYEGDEEIDEITTTGDIEGYNTQFAFKDDDDEKRKRKFKSPVSEEIDRDDIKNIRELIRTEVARIIRDIWIKRAAWGA